MNLWQDGVIAMLAAIGLASLIWLIVSALMHFGYTPKMHTLLLIPASGDAPELQQSVHELVLLRREMRSFPRIVIVDCGLSAEGLRIAELLCEEDRWIEFCTKDAFTFE